MRASRRQVADTGEHGGLQEVRRGDGGHQRVRVPTLGGGNHGHQPIDDMVGRDPLRLRVEVPQQAVPQDRTRQRPDVVEGDMIAAMQERACLGAHESMTAPRERWLRRRAIRG